MRTAYLRWILPVIALLLMATALVIVPAMMTHAAGTGTIAPVSKPAITTPTPTPAPSHQAAPNSVWFNG